MELLDLEMRNQEVAVENTTIGEEADGRMVINTDTEQLGSLPEAVERIKVLVEEHSVKEEVIKKLETELETSKDLLNIANAEKETIKIKHEQLLNENEALKLDNVKYRKWVKNQITVNDKLKEEGAGPELKKTVKKLEEELKVKSKAFETSEKVRKDLLKKVEEEVSVRGNLEADKERLSKTVDALTKLADMNLPLESNKSKIKCRDVDKAGGCPRAGSCRFYHPEVVVTKEKDKKNIDCVHWMSGKCKFTEKICHYKHDEDKKGIKTQKRKRSEDVAISNEAGQVDFLQGLVRTLAQGSTTEAKLGSLGGSAWGMESQRSTRPRMESPEIPSRGMDGRRDSYSRARSPQGGWPSRTFYSSQEQEPRRQERHVSTRTFNRQDSPARGMDVDGLMEQLRVLEQSGRSAPRRDTVQEGINLLLRIAQQQAGRK